MVLTNFIALKGISKKYCYYKKHLDQRPVNAFIIKASTIILNDEERRDAQKVLYIYYNMNEK